jgi:aspartyl/asparaginyl beta-hydroxylase (cupin superfamily)
MIHAYVVSGILGVAMKYPTKIRKYWTEGSFTPLKSAFYHNASAFTDKDVNAY